MSDDEDIENLENATDVPSKKTFYLIAYEYDDSRVCFSDVGFLEHFAIDLYSYYKEFEGTTKAIDNLMSLSATDIEKDGYMVQNFADIPEVPDSTNAEEVSYISNQNKTINIKGNLQIAKELLSNKRAYTVKQFLSRFKHLFVKVLSTKYEYYVED